MWSLLQLQHSLCLWEHTHSALGQVCVCVCACVRACVCVCAHVCSCVLDCPCMCVLPRCTYKPMGPYLLSLYIVSWLLIGEIYPSEVRGRAVSMATSLNWLTNFIVSQTLLDIQGNLVATLNGVRTYMIALLRLFHLLFIGF